MPYQSRKGESLKTEIASGARSQGTATTSAWIERVIWPNMVYDRLPDLGLPRENPTKGRNPRDP
jgi:hypothetical protein